MAVTSTNVYRSVPGNAPNDSHNDRLATGATESLVVFSGNGNDYVAVGSGNDLIYGGGGADLLIGFTGNDVIFGDRSAYDVISSTVPEPLVVAPGNDVILAYDGADVVFAAGGLDYVNGESGDDVLDGGADRDVLYGGYGSDVISGGTGDDILWGGSPFFTVASFGSYPTYGPNFANAAGFTYDYSLSTDTPMSPVTITGTQLNQAWTGDSAPDDSSADTLDGGDGNDYIVGLGGADLIMGGRDADYIEGNDGNDTVVGGAGADYIYGQAGHDWIEGNAGNDVIVAGAGNDRIEGGEGADYISFGAGYDYVIGGSGRDLFEVQRRDITAGNWATITDLGQSVEEYEGIVLAGFNGTARFYQDGANTLIYTSDFGLVGGVIVQNITVEALMGHLGYA